MLIKKKDFIDKYNINNEEYNSTGLLWGDLESIYSDYLKFKEKLDTSAVFLFNSLMKAKNVHSVRYRIKDPEHLIEKIIRKKIRNQGLNITIENYKQEITDLIGLRALHLYKDDWEDINDYIKELWHLKEEPVANYRQGDSQSLIDFFSNKGCKVNEHRYGYRSIHYIIETQPAKQKIFAEIQVRTIFEEAWAEIDHTIRYPYDLGNDILSQFLLILNRLSGSADEMGSYIKFLKTELSNKEKQFKEQIREKEQIISSLENRLNKLDIKGKDFEDVKRDLDRLKNQNIISGLLKVDTHNISKMLLAFQNSKSISDFSEAYKALQNFTNPLSISTIKTDNKIKKSTAKLKKDTTSTKTIN